MIKDTIADDTRTAEGFPVKDRFLLRQTKDDQRYVVVDDRGTEMTTSAIYHWKSHQTMLLTLFEAQMMLHRAKQRDPDAVVMIVRAADWKAIEDRTWELRGHPRGEA